MSRALLNVQSLKVSYFTERGVVKAVDDVSMEIKENKIVGLVGESGCGKSTLGLSIPRLLSPPGRIVGGRVELRGENLLEMSEKTMANVRGRDISMIFQDPFTYLNPTMTVKDQIVEVIRRHKKKNKKEATKQAIEVLEEVRIAAPVTVLKAYPHELSGGILQRVLIAIAISCNPSLIIADEPTTALDVTVQAQILRLLGRLRDELGTSILLITHDLGVIAEICERVYVMYTGKSVEYSDVFSLFEKPQHPYTIALIDSVLSIDEFKEELVEVKGDVPDMLKLPRGCTFHPRCSRVKDVCRQKAPPPIWKSGKMVRCWLYANSGVGV